MSKFEKAPSDAFINNTFKDPNFLTWLHQLTMVGYNDNIVINTEHKEVIVLFFKEGKTPLVALAEYKEFLSRWNALTR